MVVVVVMVVIVQTYGQTVRVLQHFRLYAAPGSPRQRLAPRPRA